ncbi:hypothetical protein OAV36_02340 [Flavobacteriales bacterium]|nr:hypothetical protein [Flavobacteriales bacterium]MDG1348411.1 hypothetical protein [Flavobacteriales bacterium]
MKKTYLYYFLFLMLSPILVQSQVKSKLWYDGNSRVIFNRDALEGTIKDIDTVSTRSNGGGSTVLDLGFHFTPVDDIEIFSEIRLKNDFGGMWGNKSVVELRRLSAKGIVNNKIAFSIGDIYLKQTKFTLYNYEQELSQYEPSVFNFYRDYVNYENYYQSNYHRLQALQTNFSFNMYNFIEQLDFDAFTARVRGVEWLGKPELLMLGGSAMVRLSNKINLGSHYVNTFEVLSSSNGTVAYYNPVLNTQISYSGSVNDNPYKMLLEGGFSKRGWDGDSLAPEVKGNFIQASLHSKRINGELDLGFRYVDSDFRSMGAQTRRIQYNNSTTTYPYYSNNYTQRKVSLLDVMSDPNVYNKNLSTSLMSYNPMYSSVTPYGDATPNRIGFTAKISNINITDFFSTNIQTQYFSEVIGQGTTQKRMLNKSALQSMLLLNKLLSTKKSLILEGSMNLETVNRAGEDFEKIDFTSILYSGSISYELIKNFKIIAGAKVFYAEGNEFIADRDKYDQINDYSNHIYDSKETILIAGLQHHFTEDIYFTMQYNQFNVLDKTKTYDEFSLGRLIFMFNMNL